MNPPPWVQRVPRTLWAYLGVQVLIALYALVPGDALTVYFSGERLPGVAFGLLVVLLVRPQSRDHVRGELAAQLAG